MFKLRIGHSNLNLTSKLTVVTVNMTKSIQTCKKHLWKHSKYFIDATGTEGPQNVMYFFTCRPRKDSLSPFTNKIPWGGWGKPSPGPQNILEFCATSAWYALLLLNLTLKQSNKQTPLPTVYTTEQEGKKWVDGCGNRQMEGFNSLKKQLWIVSVLLPAVNFKHVLIKCNQTK